MTLQYNTTKLTLFVAPTVQAAYDELRNYDILPEDLILLPNIKIATRTFEAMGLQNEIEMTPPYPVEPPQWEAWTIVEPKSHIDILLLDYMRTNFGPPVTAADALNVQHVGDIAIHPSRLKG